MNLLQLIMLSTVMASCTSSGGKKIGNAVNESKAKKGTYAYDAAFLAKNNIKTIELKDEESDSRVLLAPDLQGRVMTTTAKGMDGISFGWINYRFISEGKTSQQFNPFGGEERLWLGPEGGPWSIYFQPGETQIFTNWKVPEELDTMPFDLVANTDKMAVFRKELQLINYSGVTLSAGIERSVKILSRDEAGKLIGFHLDKSLGFVGFESENTLFNIGNNSWNEKNGALSVWMLCMFNPSDDCYVFMPFKKGDACTLGQKVTDDYFGKVPPERLIINDSLLFFKVDGKLRSKIGLSPGRALPLCGSYDFKSRLLTVLSFSLPKLPAKYVNSMWGEQADPLSGDVVNSYNDGPADDGTIMGPFYEIESSSPVAILDSAGCITHIQRVYHFTGDEAKLSAISERLFHISLDQIKMVVKNP